ncbi:MAG: tetratricopeptide repeat protein, partial [Limisphaerales bacterium]
WLSHMADCQWFGVTAGGPHCVNALLHAANTVLVFALWLQLWRGAAIWPAAWIAALFAVHPLHVESVAWISERKDVLSTFFGLLALLSYARYAQCAQRRRPVAPVETAPGGTMAIGSPRLAYVLALIFFALGLMSKPMLVTWPFVMLLLDFWPLQRFHRSRFQAIILEKLPFFALTIASCALTWLAQKEGAIRSLAAVPLGYRLENTPVALARYLFKLIWPARLAVIYPMPHAIATGAVIGCSALLIAITAGAWLARKRYPFLITGWLWFLGTLAPVIGLVKVGDAAMADRYMYIPSIGIFMAVALGIRTIWKRVSLPPVALPAMAGVILAAMAGLTERQLQFWRDDATLFGHAIEVTKNNADAMINYGYALEFQGKPTAAMQWYRKAEAIAPDSYLAHVDIGNLLVFIGKPVEAFGEYRRALQLDPHSRRMHDCLGTALAALGRFREASNEFHTAMRLDPASASPHFHLGIALTRQNDLRDATNEFAQALRLAPGDPSVLVEWAKASLRGGWDAEALDQLQQAIRMDPDNFQTLAFTARVLASDKSPDVRDGAEALALAKKAEALTGGAQPVVEDVLGMAWAENGQFDAAQTAAANAIRLATAAGMKPEMIAAMRKRLELYQKHQAWTEPSDFD